MSGARGTRLSAIVAAFEGMPMEFTAFRDVEITGVECRPQEVTPGCLFCCIDEYLEYNIWHSGRDQVETALQRGAVAIVAGRRIEGCRLPQILLPEPRVAFGLAARAYYGRPDEHLALTGVTGTNGKTTTTRLLAHLVREGGLGSCASMGTLGMELDGETLEPGEYTTPLAQVNCARLARLRDAGVRFAAMEVSSHALELNRVAGIHFAGAVLTNFSRDHLDFHGNIEAYASAKKRLFEGLEAPNFAVINGDSDRASWFCSGLNADLISYGIDANTDWMASDIKTGPEGTGFLACWRGRDYRVESRLAGRFQVYNILAALAAATALGVPPERAAAAVSVFPPVSGRMESIRLPNGATAIVDFAHNPDGLKHLLENCRALKPRRMVVVFGCGGDRDRGKRPLMGRIASERADRCWLTSDNPRTEDPPAILDDIREGCRSEVRVQADRAEAIREAYEDTDAGDLLVIAGKGHEAFQLVGSEKIPYSDREEVLKLR